MCIKIILILIGSKFQEVESASGSPLAGPSVHINVTASGSTGKHVSSAVLEVNPFLADVEFASGSPLAGPSVHINVTASGSTGKHAESDATGCP